MASAWNTKSLQEGLDDALERDDEPTVNGPNMTLEQASRLAGRPINRYLAAYGDDGQVELGMWYRVSRPWLENDTEEFVYPPLSREKRQIRLVKVMPEVVLLGGPGGKASVLCEMRTVSLDSNPAFWAVSYAWGDASKTKPVYLDHYEVQVTETLEALLQELRTQRLGHLLLWIDAICINQQDDSEKSWQVGMMKTIYEHAAKVVCWLGPAADDSDKVIDALDRIGKEVMSIPDNHDIPVWVADAMKDEDCTPFDVPAMSAFLSRPWWGRAWCLQELASANQFDFACGSKWLHGFVCSKGLEAFRHYKASFIRSRSAGVLASLLRNSYLFQLYFCQDLDKQATMFGTWADMHRCKYVAQLAEVTECGSPVIKWNFDIQPIPAPLSLASLLCRLSGNGAEASDPRDMVFALIGMANDSHELGLSPDYSKDCCSVYIATATALLLRKKLLRLLHLCQFPKRQPNLPSWVPDWSSQPETLFSFSDLEAQLLGRTPYASSRNIAPEIGISEEEDGVPILSVKGFFIDKVISTKDTAPDIRSKPRHLMPKDWEFDEGACRCVDENATRFCKVVRDWVEKIEQLRFETNDVYPTEDDSYNAVWMTAAMSVYKDQERMRPLINSRAFVEELISGSMANSFLTSFDSNADVNVSNRAPFTTSQGFLGNGPPNILPNDVVVVIFGLDVPIVLRRQEKDRFEVVGVVYVHGIMDGEALDMGKEAETFDIC